MIVVSVGGLKCVGCSCRDQQEHICLYKMEFLELHWLPLLDARAL